MTSIGAGFGATAGGGHNAPMRPLRRLRCGAVPSEERLRIAFYTRSADPSGMGAHMLDLIASFADSADVTLLARTSPNGRWLCDGAARLGARTVALPSPHDPSYADVIRGFLTSRPVDVFHGHAGWGWEDSDGFRMARDLGVPAVLLTHHLPFLLHDRRKARRQRKTDEQADHLIAVSDGVRRSYERIGVPSARFTTVPNGVGSRGPGPGRAAARRELGIADDQLVIMTAGRLVKMKGQRYLIEALPQLLKRFPNLTVVVLGRGGLHDQLAKLAAERGVADAVHLAGHRSDARLLLDAADVFALPSRSEGMPLAAIEAMDAGLPVVATRVVGSDEVVLDGTTGILVPTENPAALAAALADLLADPAKRAAYGAAGRRSYLDQFTVERMAERTADVYQRILGKHADPLVLKQGA